MVEDAPQSAVVDTTVPSIARVYDYAVGGKDNFAVDRAVGDKVGEVAPEAFAMARESRFWLSRAVHFLAGRAGIDQFLDCGSGLPTAENTHQVAQRINPEARVVYVDNDPVVAAHGRALLEENENTVLVAGDLQQPAQVLGDPVVNRMLDLSRPYALMQCSTIHHINDDDEANAVMAAYVDALPSGSYVAISHFFGPDTDSELSDLARDVEQRLQAGLGTSRFRTREQIGGYLNGLELVEPGLVTFDDWWPPGPRLRERKGMDYLVLCAVAYKP